jgi:hypothetical protein
MPELSPKSKGLDKGGKENRGDNDGSKLKYTPPFLNRTGTHIKKWSGRRKRYRLQYGNRGF